jgi:hypothetical protein
MTISNAEVLIARSALAAASFVGARFIAPVVPLEKSISGLDKSSPYRLKSMSYTGNIV